jgi:hypothetical protein
MWVNAHYVWGGGAPPRSHSVLFSKVVHVWTSTTVILEYIFPNILHNMVNHNTINYIYISTYIVWFQNIFVTKKCKYTLKMIKMIFSL